MAKTAVVMTTQRVRQLLNQPFITSIRWARFLFVLRGLSPLLMDRITEEQKKTLITKKKVEYPPDEPFDKKARRRLYSDRYVRDMPAGQIVIPSENLYAALRDAGEKVQYGSGKNDRITLASKGTELFYMVRLIDPFFPVLGLDGKPASWEHDLRRGNPSQGGKGGVGILRPKFPEWGIVGHVDINIDALLPDTAQRLFQVMGIRQGLCSGRPAKKMPFGQCGLVHFGWVGGEDPNTARVESSEEELPESTETGASDKGNGTLAVNPTKKGRHGIRRASHKAGRR